MNEILTSTEFDKSNKLVFYGGAALALLLLITASVLFVLYLQQDPKPVKNLEMQKANVIQEKFNKSEWVFEVLYPATSASQAATTIDELIADGYQIQSTGSAKADQKTITLRVSPGMKQKADLLLKDLSKFFKVTTFTADYNSRRTNAQLIFN